MHKIILINILSSIFLINTFSQDYMDDRYFSNVFSRSCNNMTNLETERITIDNTVSAFRAYIYGEYTPGGYGMTDVFYQYQPAAILNYGKRFSYAFYSPSFPAKFKDKILEELSDLKEEFLEEYDDMNANWQVVDNSKILLTAEYQYFDGGGAVENRLHFLMKSSERLSYQVIAQSHITMQDWKDELEDMHLEYLSRLDLNSLMPRENFEKYAKEDPNSKEGAFAYSLNEIDVEIRNYGDRIDLIYENVLPSDPGKDNFIIEKMLEIAKENIPEGNPQISVFIPEHDQDVIWVAATYIFDKSFTGDDFINYFDDFMSNFLEDMDSEFNDLLDDLDQ